VGHGLTPAVALVADGGARAGLGHLGRCSAIAAALDAAGVRVSCHAYEADAPVAIDGVEWTPLEAMPGAPVVVLDSYSLAPEDVGATVVALHDSGPLPAGARLVVSVGSRGEGVLGGLEHAPLRRPFWDLPVRAVRSRVERVLVTTGGGVVAESGVELARLAQAEIPGAAVALVRGPFARFDAPPGVELVAAPASLAGELLAADLVISAAGQTALEAAATGAPCIALPLVDNQRGNARALAAAGAAVVVEPGADVATAVAELAASLDTRAALAGRAQAAVDGRGAARIAAAIAALSPPGAAA
jgi:spore coat polysaccharide biosynthesis predicted glycosyltransferase SpsG